MSFASMLREKLTPRFLKFAASSLISTGVDQGLAFVLFRVLKGPLAGSDYLRILIGTLVARVCSVTVNYAINQKRVFSPEGDVRRPEREELAGELSADEASGVDFDDIIEGPDDEVRSGTVEVRPMRESLPRFIVLAAFVLLLSSMGVTFLHGRFGINESIAKLGVDFALFFLNYFVQRNWVFARREGKSGSKDRNRDTAQG